MFVVHELYSESHYNWCSLEWKLLPNIDVKMVRGEGADTPMIF